MINKETWREFKNHPGFVEFEAEMRGVVLQATQELVERKADSGSDQRDFFLRGAIWALAELHDFNPDFAEEMKEEEDEAA